MRNAVIVVGSHYSGKSRTIRQYVKPELKIGPDKRKFERNGQSGFVLSQTFEEANRDIQKTIAKYSHYSLLVLAARPERETPSCLVELKAELEKSGYRVTTVEIIKTSNDAYYEGKAEQIVRSLDHVGTKTASA